MALSLPAHLTISIQRRAAIVAAEADAERRLRAVLMTISWCVTGLGTRYLTFADYELVRSAVTTFVTTAVLAFARQLCEAAREEDYPIDHILGAVDARIAAVAQYAYRELDEEKVSKAWWNNGWGTRDAWGFKLDTEKRLKGSDDWRDFLSALGLVAHELAKRDHRQTTDAAAPARVRSDTQASDATTGDDDVPADRDRLPSLEQSSLADPVAETLAIEQKRQRRQAFVMPLLKLKRLSRLALATRAGVNPSVVYGYLAGESNPTALNHQAIAGALDVDDNDLPQ
jgi:hypothetical protein